MSQNVAINIELIAAVKRGDLAQVQRFVREVGTDMAATDEFGRSILFFAVEAPNHEILKWLLAAGADILHTDGDGYKVLMSAIMNSYFSRGSMAHRVWRCEHDDSNPFG